MLITAVILMALAVALLMWWIFPST